MVDLVKSESLSSNVNLVVKRIISEGKIPLTGEKFSEPGRRFPPSLYVEIGPASTPFCRGDITGC